MIIIILLLFVFQNKTYADCKIEKQIKSEEDIRTQPLLSKEPRAQIEFLSFRYL